MDVENQQVPQVLPPNKPNIILISLSVVFLVLLLITSIMIFNYKSKAKDTKNIKPTPDIISPSPTTIMKEEYVNPFSPTGTTGKQYNNPFEKTTNPFDELTK